YREAAAVRAASPVARSTVNRRINGAAKSPGVHGTCREPAREASARAARFARFVFHAPLKKAARQAQELVIRQRLRKLRLSKAATVQILTVDGISSAQLESAVKAARLVKAGSRSERDQAIVQAIRRSQRALSRELTEAFKPSVTRYSL